LLYRGNLDGIVLLAIMVSIAAVGRFDLIAGMMIAIAAALKVYPLLLVLPLLLHRCYWAVLCAAITLVMLIAPDPALWTTWLSDRISVRAEAWHPLENGSFAATGYWLAALTGRSIAAPRVVGEVCFVMLVVWAVSRNGLDAPSTTTDRARSVRQSMLLFMPLLAAVPALAYHYELVVLLPLLPWLAGRWERADPRQRFWLRWLAGGFILSQLHAIAVSRFCAWSVNSLFIPEALGWFRLPHALPGLGLLLAAVAAVALMERPQRSR
jgi:hypothetical protein